MFDMNFESLEVILIFQVMKDGKVMFWTQDKSCVPTESQIKKMKKAGYGIKVKEDKNEKIRK